jgi:hypothetical protein
MRVVRALSELALALGVFCLPTATSFAQPQIASDGQSLATQSAATQVVFNAVWGSNAAAEWVREHNAALEHQTLGPSPFPMLSAMAAAPIRLTFELHMEFFSKETQQPTVIDPQVFVMAPGASAGTGPQNIQHAAGVAPAQATDPDTTPLLDAEGSPLDITLGVWKAATGHASITCQGSTESLSAQFNNLLPNASYSFFDVHLRVQGAGRFTPLAANNSFKAGADGSTEPAVTGITPCLGSDDAVVLVWNSDGQPHGNSIGSPGVNAHNQLIVPVGGDSLSPEIVRAGV